MKSDAEVQIRIRFFLECWIRILVRPDPQPWRALMMMDRGPSDPAENQDPTQKPDMDPA